LQVATQIALTISQAKANHIRSEGMSSPAFAKAKNETVAPERIRANFPNVFVLIYSDHEEGEFVLQAIKAGVWSCHEETAGNGSHKSD
jgi:DNA-binding NarL/FixJ family response regulator